MALKRIFGLAKGRKTIATVYTKEKEEITIINWT